MSNEQNETVVYKGYTALTVIKCAFFCWGIHYAFTIFSAGSVGLQRFLSDCETVRQFCANCLGAI